MYHKGAIVMETRKGKRKLKNNNPLTEHKSVLFRVRNIPKILQRLGSESILAPKLLHISFPACCIPSFKICILRSQKSYNTVVPKKFISITIPEIIILPN